MLVAPPDYVNVGIDDSGTGDGSMTGWASIVVDPVAHGRLKKKHSDLVRRAPFCEFHASKACSSEIAHWQRFGETIVETCRTAQYASATFVLLPRALMDKYIADASHFVLSVVRCLSRSSIHSPDFERALDAATPPVFWLGRYLGQCLHSPSCRAKVEMDESNLTKLLREKYLINGVMKSGEDWLAMIYDGCMKSQSLRVVQINEGDIRVVASQDSALVQAADFMANFGRNHLRVSLGATSRTGSWKSALFNEVFSPAIDSVTSLTLSSSGEIVPVDPASCLPIELELRRP